MGFDTGQQFNNTYEAAKAREIKLVDERFEALKLSAL